MFQASDGTLKVSGYLRGADLSADRLVHVVGWGTYQIAQIDAARDPHPLVLRKDKPGQVGGVLPVVCYLWCVTCGVLPVVCYLWCVAVVFFLCINTFCVDRLLAGLWPSFMQLIETCCGKSG